MALTIPHHAETAPPWHQTVTLRGISRYVVAGKRGRSSVVAQAAGERKNIDLHIKD
ncbi:MAG: hypothetical protein FWG24_05380 [Eggerthellaceae bacterium]|nr:hypothetical protein [Eggerthellaceae bacterium]